MSDQNPAPIMPPGHGNPLQSAIIIWILYGVGILFPAAALGGLIFAYVERGKDPVLDTHLSIQIRTFWWGLMWIFVGTVLLFVLVGFLVYLAWFVWLVVRIITGAQLAQARQPVQGTELMGAKLI